VKLRIFAAPHLANVIVRMLNGGWLAGVLLSAGCGARTGVASDLSSASVPGTGGAATCSKDWDQITWEDSVEEAAVYLWTTSANDTWAVVSGNPSDPQSFFRDHWDGGRWKRTASDGAAGQRFENQQIWAAEGALALAGARQQLQSWSGYNWTDWRGTPPGCHALGGTAPSDFWCASESVLSHFDGERWMRAPIANSIQGILAKARDDVWIWGAGGASHFDGTRWTIELSDPIRQISASGPRDVWAVRDGDLLHSTGPGTKWTSQNPTGGRIASVWSESSSNTWIVAAGAAMRWNGASWVVMDLPMQDERLLISGSAEDIWIAGTQILAHGRPACR
jgi:hypothetical protein